MIARYSIPLAVLLLAAGCAPDGSTEQSPDLGAAVNYNMAVHILPITPPAAGSPIDMPGRRSDVLMERYMTGKVKQPSVDTAGKSQMLMK